MQARRERSEQRQEDFVVSLGRPFLAHRLRRLSELLVDQMADVRSERGMKSPPRASSTLLLLEQEGTLAVTEIAARLRLSHPLIIKMIDALTRDGFLVSAMDSADRRRRCVSLTGEGKAEARRVRKFMQSVDQAFDGLASDLGTDVYDFLVRVEDAIQEQPLSARIRIAAAGKPGR